ncbi:MAG: hypothetical protein RO469_15190 [Thermincola sp.]|jgi:hypothetical protein|nr:hypothetical protein [Thermincola sp.]MDT3702694.1 hypothetical protein [Thermincola sp.]
MLRKHNNNERSKNGRQPLKDSSGLNYFHFTLSEKNHEITLPVEQETAWEKLHDITWDPGRGD